jgi:four helix bundle protein
VAKCVEELQVWQRTHALATEVCAATEAVAFARYSRLVEQVNETAGSVLANIAEGFGQGSDRAFARFVGIARGSCNELRSHLAVAATRRCLTEDAHARLRDAAHEVSRMLTGLERYLVDSDRTRRG